MQYLAGRRKHYVLPLRLYLSISLVALLMLRIGGHLDLVGGLSRPELAAVESGAVPSLMLNVRGVHVGIRDGTFICETLPTWLCGQLRQGAATDPPNFLHRLRQANERVTANLGVVMFVLLPAFAAHLVFARDCTPSGSRCSP